MVEIRFSKSSQEDKYPNQFNPMNLDSRRMLNASVESLLLQQTSTHVSII